MTTTSAQTIELGPTTGSITLHTTRAGIGAKVGHDLTIAVTEWSGTLQVNLLDPESSTAELRVVVDSLVVLSGDGGLKALTDSDKADIRETIRKKVLHTDRHPVISFASTKLTGTPADHVLTGDLSIGGVTRSVSVAGGMTSDGITIGECRLNQSDFGIKPFSAMLGALRLADEVIIRYDLALPTLAQR